MAATSAGSRPTAETSTLPGVRAPNGPTRAAAGDGRAQPPSSRAPRRPGRPCRSERHGSRRSSTRRRSARRAAPTTRSPRGRPARSARRTRPRAPRPRARPCACTRARPRAYETDVTGRRSPRRKGPLRPRRRRPATPARTPLPSAWPRSFERDHELADQVAVPRDAQLAGPNSALCGPAVVCDRPVAFVPDVANLDLVVGRLRLVGRANLVAAAERAYRHALEAHLGVVREPPTEGLPVSAADGRVVHLDVLLEGAHGSRSSLTSP